MSTRSRHGDNKAKSRVIRIDDSSDSDERSSSNNKKNNKTESKSSKISSSNSSNSIHSENGKSSNSKKPDSKTVSELESITGLSKKEASELLEACNNDVNMAINIHFGTDIGSLDTCGAPTNGTTKKTAATAAAAAAANFEDNVRAPIPQKTEKLIDYDPYAVTRPVKRTRSVFDSFRDLQQEFDESDDGSSKSKKRHTLAQLFRPPLEILFSGSFDAAKRLGCRAHRWILLNIQNTEEFECQCLNRDLWSDDTVKEIIKANFIFNQVYHDTPEGQKLINYYNVHSYPFVAVIDPRTGEKVAQWSKLDSHLFCEMATNFLADNELPVDGANDSFTSPNSDKSKKIKNNIDDYDNDDCDIDKSKSVKQDHKHVNNGKTPFSPKLPDLKYLSFSDRFDTNSSKSPKKLNSKQATDEILKKKKSSIITNNHISSSSSEEEVEFKVKITDKKAKTVEETKIKQENGTKNDHNKTNNETVNNTVKEVSSVPKIIKYETTTMKKDCHLRIMLPNGDRLDFITDGDANIKLLIDYLKKEGYTKPRYELIERTFTSIGNTNDANSQINQSRNLFNCNLNSTFKQLNLYPRIFLLLQDTLE